MKPFNLLVVGLLLCCHPFFAQQKVGINVNDPSVSLEVSGRIQINEESATPEPGQIRWNSSTSDFEGYNGSDWISFTNNPSGSTQGTTGPNTMQDIEGNEYKTVVIGTQEWMAENLRTTRFNDGVPIPYVPKPAVWRQLNNLGQPGYVWPDNDIGNKYPYGALYNGYAIVTGKLCPTGWSVPTESDWNTLLTFLGSGSGSQMKQTGNLSNNTGLFNPANADATNSSGFSAIPAGIVINLGSTTSIGSVARFGSRTLFGSQLYIVFLTTDSPEAIPSTNYTLIEGHSIRCIKD